MLKDIEICLSGKIKYEKVEKLLKVFKVRMQTRTICIILTFLLCQFWVSCRAFAEETKWKTIESADFKIYCEKTSQGQKVLNRANRAFPDIVSDLDYQPKSKINIYVYNNHSLFLKESPIGVTTAYSQPFLNKIAISITKEPDLDVIDHEISHVVFFQSLPDTAKVPFWFVEGLAIFQSGPNQDVSKAKSEIYQGEIGTITDLSWEKPEDSKTQQENAIKGYSVIEYIVKKYGKNTLQSIIKDLQKGDNFFTALESNLGVSKNELSREWYEYKRAQSKQMYMQNLQYIGFFAIGILTIAATCVWFRNMWKRRHEFDEETEEDREKEEEI